MICVSIGRGRHRHVIAEYRHLVDQGARLVELRLDYINGEVNLKRLVADRPCPVVISCRRAVDGGKYAGGEEQRQLLLRSGHCRGGRVRRPGRRRGRVDPAFRPHQADHQRPRLPQDARQSRRDPPPPVRAGPGHRQAQHDGQSSARQPADAGVDPPQQGADDRRVHGRHRHRPPGFWPASSALRSATPRSITSGCWPPDSSASSR